MSALPCSEPFGMPRFNVRMVAVNDADRRGVLQDRHARGLNHQFIDGAVGGRGDQALRVHFAYAVRRRRASAASGASPAVSFSMRWMVSGNARHGFVPVTDRFVARSLPREQSGRNQG